MQRNEKTKFIKEAVSWNPEEIKKKEGVGCKKTWMRTTQREGEKKTFNHMVQRDHSGEIRQGWR